jgi:hypothetical protein
MEFRVCFQDFRQFLAVVSNDEPPLSVVECAEFIFCSSILQESPPSASGPHEMRGRRTAVSSECKAMIT